jgi:hypothetical protein
MALTASQNTAAAFLVGFGIQQTIETVDAIVTAILALCKTQLPEALKKGIYKVLSLGLGYFFVTALDIDVLVDLPIASEWHRFITVVAVAGGTEGVNSVLKYLVYIKENKKNAAAVTLNAAPPLQRDLIGRK